jgi:hypothetical protein
MTAKGKMKTTGLRVRFYSDGVIHVRQDKQKNGKRKFKTTDNQRWFNDAGEFRDALAINAELFP